MFVNNWHLYASDEDSDSSNASDEKEMHFRTENYLEVTIPSYSEADFHMHFRMSRVHVNSLAERYGASDVFKNQPGQFGLIGAHSEMLIFIWYIAHESSFRDVADRFNITISSLHRILQKTIYFVSNLAEEVIRWPNEREKRESKMGFWERGFPRTIGAIDGTHIKIDKPTVDHETYYNRKNDYSIQLQCVCDHNSKILDLFVGFPGSVHDARVFNHSNIGRQLSRLCGNRGQYVILGDSAYPLKGNLMTPFKHNRPLTRREVHYNNMHSTARVIIENCFGILKQKFKQMRHVRLRQLDTIIHFIRAACVLHNFSMGNGQFENVPMEHGLEEGQNLEALDGRQIREEIMNELHGLPE